MGPNGVAGPSDEGTRLSTPGALLVRLVARYFWTTTICLTGITNYPNACGSDTPVRSAHCYLCIQSETHQGIPFHLRPVRVGASTDKWGGPVSPARSTGFAPSSVVVIEDGLKIETWFVNPYDTLE